MRCTNKKYTAPIHKIRRWVAKRYRTNELTFRVYEDLRKYGLCDEDIRVAFGVPREPFYFFITQHLKILKTMKGA